MRLLRRLRRPVPVSSAIDSRHGGIRRLNRCTAGPRGGCGWFLCPRAGLDVFGRRYSLAVPILPRHRHPDRRMQPPSLPGGELGRVLVGQRGAFAKRPIRRGRGRQAGNPAIALSGFPKSSLKDDSDTPWAETSTKAEL